MGGHYWSKSQRPSMNAVSLFSYKFILPYQCFDFLSTSWLLNYDAQRYTGWSGCGLKSCDSYIHLYFHLISINAIIYIHVKIMTLLYSDWFFEMNLSHKLTLCKSFKSSNILYFNILFKQDNLIEIVIQYWQNNDTPNSENL